jgi:hypothetical protein
VISAGGLGGLLGAAGTGWLTRRFGPLGVVFCCAVSGAALLLLGAAFSAPVALAANVLCTWAIVAASVTNRSLRQALIPRPRLGRVMASWRLTIQGATLAGGLLAAAAAALAGSPPPRLRRGRSPHPGDRHGRLARRPPPRAAPARPPGSGRAGPAALISALCPGARCGSRQYGRRQECDREGPELPGKRRVAVAQSEQYRDAIQIATKLARLSGMSIQSGVLRRPDPVTVIFLLPHRNPLPDWPGPP